MTFRDGFALVITANVTEEAGRKDAVPADGSLFENARDIAKRYKNASRDHRRSRNAGRRARMDRRGVPARDQTPKESVRRAPA